MFYDGRQSSARERHALWEVARRAADFDRADRSELLARLDGFTDRGRVADAADAVLLAALRGVQRAKAALAAQELELVAELTRRRDETDLQLRAVADEIALECGLTRYAADKLQGLAFRLTETYPATLDALAQGRLDARKAEVIADGLARVRSDTVRAVLEEQAIGVADGSLLPNGQLRPESLPPVVTGVNVPTLRNLLKAWVLAAEPEVAEERAVTARAARRVVFTPVEDDMVELWALLPAEDGLRIQAVVNQTADAVKGDGRTADQGRADVLVDLLTTTAPGDRVPVPVKSRVNLTVPFEVLTGDSDRPGYLAGYGPVSAALARRLAADTTESGTFHCAIVDGEHGTLLGLGRSTHTSRYVASEALKRHVTTRDRFCRFPGCRTQASACDFDHRTAHSAGGPTCECNGQSLCGRHHRVKHETGFTVRLPEQAAPPGTLIWRTPTGRDHADVPIPF